MSKSILVIEDDKEHREPLVKALHEKRYTVDSAEDAESGSNMARNNDYDLVVLDNVLPQNQGVDQPELRGAQVCKEIRDSGKTMPILGLSVRAETETRKDLYKAKADAYVAKPYDLEELLLIIEQLLRRPPNIEAEIIELGDMRFDPHENILWRGERKIEELTFQESKILEDFMRNPNQTRTYSVIMEKVWGAYADISLNAIAQHILNLRKKMNFNGLPDPIKAVPGAGYKFEVPE